MNNAQLTLSPRPVLWRQVWGLTAVQASITLAWVIYNVYLLDLLKQFGFAAEFAVVLLFIENGLAIAMEPLMGSLSDRAIHRLGTRYSFITVGILLASALFISIPAIFIFGGGFSNLKWLMVAVIILWAMAMTVFRSPAIALLRKYSRTQDLPITASLLTLATAFVGAARPFSNRFILSLGAPATFAIGSGVLLAALAILRTVKPNFEIIQDSPQESQSPVSKLSLLLNFAIGFSISFGARLLLGEIFPRGLRTGFPDLSLDLLMGLAGIAIGISAFPVGWLAARFGNQKLLLIGLQISIFCSFFLALANGSILTGLVVAIAAIAFSTVSNSAIALALSTTVPSKAGLGIGMYFSGGAAAVSTFVKMFPVPSQISSLNVAVLTMCAFLLAATCAIGSRQYDLPIELE